MKFFDFPRRLLRKKKNQHPSFHIWVVIAVVVSTLALGTGVTLAILLNAPEPPAFLAFDDKDRLNDLEILQLTLETYAKKRGAYPSATNYTALCDVLMSANVGFLECAHDPKAFQDYEYVPKCDESGCTGYVLKAFLDRSSNELLENDLDNIVHGLDCSDPAYCIER